jgi:hypothetical protein
LFAAVFLISSDQHDVFSSTGTVPAGIREPSLAVEAQRRTAPSQQAEAWEKEKFQYFHKINRL